VIVLVAAAVWALAELIWAASADLRSHRLQFRLQLAFFFVVVAAIYAGSTLRILPDRFHYGNGVLRYASDSIMYQRQAATIADDVRHGSIAGLRDPQQFLYSKLLAAVFVLTGTHPLIAMLVNALFYVATLACIFLIASEMFGPWVAPRATAICAVWPGFVLHEAQTLRSAETMLGVELLILGILIVLRRGWSVKGLAVALTGYAFLLTDQAYLARLTSVLIVVFGATLWIYLRSRRERTRPAVAMTALGALTVLLFQLMWTDSERRVVDLASVHTGGSRPTEVVVVSRVIRATWERVEGSFWSVAFARRGFQIAELERTGNLAGATPPLMTFGDLMTNLPTAFATALLAPFPWHVDDDRGVTNLRKFIWFELIPYYALLPLSLVGLVTTIVTRARTPALSQAAFILAFTIAVYALLGTVVVNVGTLYRFRLPYVLLQMIFAVEGFRILTTANAKSRSASVPVGAASSSGRSSASLL
jgi:hypothetical protein